MKMTQKEKQTLNITIEEHIFKLKNQISILQEKAKPIAPDCSLGRLTRAEAMAEQEVNNRVLEEANLRLVRLNNAHLRIDKEMFGICLECEEEIALGRMLIRPESLRCVDCAT